METSEMLDVIHVFFEEDTIPRWEHDVEVKNKFRETIYRLFYKTEYKYGYTSNQGRSAEWGAGADGMYAEPTDGTIKPYIPPSSEQELATIVGPAMGE